MRSIFQSLTDFLSQVTTETEREALLKELNEDVGSGVDNRTIVDDGSSQKLSTVDIMKFRESGKSGNEIINELIENSASFSAKTRFSQEKFILKKSRKYCQYLSVHRPKISDLQEIESSGARGGAIRMDSLAQILAYSDVQAEGNYLLYDGMTTGLVASALLDRIGASTKGRLLSLHRFQNKPILPKFMQFPSEQMERLVSFNLFRFLRLCRNQDTNEVRENGPTIGRKRKFEEEEEEQQQRNGGAETNEMKKVRVEGEDEREEKTQITDELTEPTLTVSQVETQQEKKDEEKNGDEMGRSQIVVVDELAEPVTENQVEAEEKLETREEKKKLIPKTVRDRIERILDMMRDKKFCSLIIVAKEHPLNIVKTLLRHLESSRPFVVFHHNREVLLETYVELKQHYSVANLKLLFNNLRSYQILQDRTHPDNDANDCGGYILTGYFLK